MSEIRKYVDDSACISLTMKAFAYLFQRY